MTDREKLIDLLMKSHGVEPVDYRGYEWAADYLIANGVTINRGTEDTPVDYKLSPTEPLTNCQQWISVTERLPEPETEVLCLAERKIYSIRTKGITKYHIVTTGMYEDGKNNTEDSGWVWETDGFEYDEELDAYIIPEGWWEYKHYNGDEQNNYAIDDVVTHWMPIPEPPKGE